MNIRRFLVVAALAIASAVALNFIALHARKSGGMVGHTVSPPPGTSAAARSLHPNYPYSVIPGGAYSPAELRTVSDKDSLVRDHYADFNMRSAQLVMLTDDRYQYVSFRLKNHIFWTHKKLRIPKGEILLTDGHNYARTRCGNRLSSTPQASTTELEPAERLLSPPPFDPRLLPQLSFAEPPIGELAERSPALPARLAPVLPGGTEAAMKLPENWPPIANYPPMNLVPSGYLPPPNKSPTPGTPNVPPPTIPPTKPPVVSQVPEPASLYLFVISFALALWILARIMRRNRDLNNNSEAGD